MAFKADRLKKLVWPDLAGVGAAILGHYVSRGIDHAQEWTSPFKRLQDWTAVGMLGTSTVLYGMDKAPEFSEAWFNANTTLVAEGIADKVFGPPEEAFGRLKAKKRLDATQVRDTRQPPKKDLLPEQGRGSLV